MKAKSVSMSELEQFIDGEMPSETQESYLTFDSTKSNRLGKSQSAEWDFAKIDYWDLKKLLNRTAFMYALIYVVFNAIHACALSLN